MPDCSSIDPLITPFVDGDIGAADRQRVDEHLRVCAPCHSRVGAEQAVRDLLHARRASLTAGSASAALRNRCAALGSPSVQGSRAGVTPTVWRGRMAPLALAATLVVVVGGAFVYVYTDRSTRLLAAELTADHVKCFGVNAVIGTNSDVVAIQRAMASTFGWEMHVPESTDAGLEVVGGRPCLYAKGKAAHLMYRHHGQPLSVFMLPQLMKPGLSDSRPEVVDVLGHEAFVWTQAGRTFVLIAREPEQEMSRVVSVIQAGLR